MQFVSHSLMVMGELLNEGVEMNYLGSDGDPIVFEAPVVRKPTYVLRKEEKENLLNEVEQLQTKLKTLEEAERQRVHDELQQQLQRAQLRNVVRQQHLSLASVHSTVSAYVSKQDSLPCETSFRLGSDFTQRRNVLIAARQRTLEGWLAYSTARTRYLDPFRPVSETSRFSLDSGDYCALCLDQTPLLGTNLTVRQVFDTVVANHSSIDIRITDAFNDITTGDDIGYGMEGARQIRLSSRLACGVDAEMNSINFHEYFDEVGQEHNSGPVGVFTVDFVDHDELYPYQTSERVRLDVSGVLVIRGFKRARHCSVTGRDEEEKVIMATQTSLYKVRRPGMLLPKGVEHRMRRQLGKWGNAMMSAVLDQIHGQFGGNT